MKLEIGIFSIVWTKKSQFFIKNVQKYFAGLSSLVLNLVFIKSNFGAMTTRLEPKSIPLLVAIKIIEDTYLKLS